MSQLETTTELPEPTDARFSIRAGLIVMAVVAGVAALVGPLVRRLDSTTQVRLLAAWSIWMTAALLWVGYLVYRRARVEKLAGRTLLRLPMFDERVATGSPTRRWVNVIASLFMCVMVLLLFSETAVQPRPGRSGGEFVSFCFLSMLSIFWLGRAVAIAWWRRSIRLCEAGLLWDHSLLQWDHLLEHSWNEHDAGVLVVRGTDQKGAEAVWRVPVPASELGHVQALFDARASRPSIPAGLPLTHLGSIPLSVAVRDANFFKVIGRIVFGIVALIGYVMLLRAVPVSSEFSYAVFFGLIGSAVLGMRGRGGLKQSGRPLVRLLARRRWGTIGAFVAAAAMCYYVGFAYGWISEALNYAMGAAFGISGVTALAHMFPGYIDLRENGIGRPGWPYWPWSQVRVVAWDRDGSGRLVIERGWRRIAARVPLEQREVVDRVLTEKLAHAAT